MLSRDASDLSALLVTGRIEDAEARLLQMAGYAGRSSFATLALAALHAAQTLATTGVSGSLGATLMVLGDELRLLAGPGID